MNASQKHSQEMLEGFNSMKESNGQFADINTLSQKELFDISKDIFEMTGEIKENLGKIKQKTTEIIALEASLVALEVASLGAMAGK